MPTRLHLAPVSNPPASASAGQTGLEPAPLELGPPTRVLLADDHPGMLRGLRQLLACEHDIDVVGDAEDLELVTRCMRAQRPDVLVIDLSLPGGSSIEAIGQLRELAAETEIVVLTMQDSASVAQRALNAGACGYVMKDLADTELPQ